MSPKMDAENMTIIKTPWGGRSPFVLALFSDVNKTGTNHEHPIGQQRCHNVAKVVNQMQISQGENGQNRTTLLTNWFWSEWVSIVYLVANGENFQCARVCVDTTFIPCICTL